MSDARERAMEELEDVMAWVYNAGILEMDSGEWERRKRETADRILDALRDSEGREVVILEGYTSGEELWAATRDLEDVVEVHGNKNPTHTVPVALVRRQEGESECICGGVNEMDTNPNCPADHGGSL